MKINRTKNAVINLIFSVLLRIYRIIVPFLMRTVFIYTIGIEFLGLNSLFTSVLQMLNLAELGVGSAMVYSMYKPIVDNDDKKICALMHMYKIYYRVIGLVVLALGICLIPFVPNLIKGDVPEGISIYILYFMHLGCTVLSYWLFAYKNSLLTAYQRTDVTSKVSLGIDTLKYLTQLFVLFVLKDYYTYVLIILVMQVVENVTIALCVNKMYPQYKAHGKLPKEEVGQINQRIRDLFTAKLGMVVINSADTIVISAFLGLVVLAVYQNYFFIITSLTGLMSTIYASCRAGIGNSLIIESEEKNYGDLRTFTLLISWVATVVTSCLLCMMQPFMKLWMGEEFLLSFGCVVCLCTYFFVYEINQLLTTYKDAAGIWSKDRFRPLVTALSNLLLNILLVNYIGIFGVILSTVVTTLFIGMPWLIHNLFTELFHCGVKKYVAQLIKCLMIVTISCLCSYGICSLLTCEGLLELIGKGGICFILSNVMMFLCWHRSDEFIRLVNMVRRMLKRA